MYENFTNIARRVMQVANQEAARYHHEFIHTEDILLAFMVEGTGVAAHVLQNLGVRLWQIRTEVEKVANGGPSNEKTEELQKTPRAKKAIENAIEESRALSHNYVGTEHLLLGILREEECIASGVLLNLGIRLEDVRAEVLRLLGEPQVPEKVNPTEDSAMARIGHLPDSARKIVEEFERLRDRIQTEKEATVADQEYERAAELLALANKLTKLKADFILQWPKKP